jgi:hypothetical protein
MKTIFQYYDESNNLISANLILSFVYDNIKYVVYDLNSNDDTMYIREYEEKDGKPYLYKVDDERLNQIKEIITNLSEEIK